MIKRAKNILKLKDLKKGVEKRGNKKIQKFMDHQKLRDAKSLLKPTVTRVTRVDGAVTLEQGDTVLSVDDGQRSAGYVVDTEPDLQVAEILPWLFISSQDVAADLNILRDNNISHILNVGWGLDINRGNDSDITEKKVEILDDPGQNIDDALEDCFKYLEECRESGSNVLVHCNAGVSRSAAVVIGYLMQFRQFSYDQAHHHVKTRRPCIRPNDGFVTQLKKRDTNFYDDTEKKKC